MTSYSTARLLMEVGAIFFAIEKVAGMTEDNGDNVRGQLLSAVQQAIAISNNETELWNNLNYLCQNQGFPMEALIAYTAKLSEIEFEVQPDWYKYLKE